MRVLVRVSCAVLIGLGSAVAAPARAQQALPEGLRAGIDRAVGEALAESGAPSASIALVWDGAIAYARAFGDARLEPRVAATAEMRYPVGSISKQFTAAAVLLLVEEGRLSLDDRIVRFLPDLTRAGDVTLREVLSMTSGYQDFWPQDYVMPDMLRPAGARTILDGWARKPLDFEPGTAWQYSDTNYVIAGRIVEQVAGMPLFEFLQRRIFAPLRMASVVDTDDAGLGPGDPARYLRYALGPPRPAPREGRGWLFAAGELAMAARDLAAWDVSMIDQTVLKPSSYRAMETEVLLANGVGTRYGLGVGVATSDGRRVIAHGGEVSGFTARNAVFPDDRAAIVVLVNQDASNAPERMANRIAALLFAPAGSQVDKALSQARSIFAGLQHGRIDRALFTANGNSYFDAQALSDFATSLGPLGEPRAFTQLSQSLRGGMTLRRYSVRFAARTLRVWTFALPDGRLEQFMVAPAE